MPGSPQQPKNGPQHKVINNSRSLVHGGSTKNFSRIKDARNRRLHSGASLIVHLQAGLGSLGRRVWGGEGLPLS